MTRFNENCRTYMPTVSTNERSSGVTNYASWSFRGMYGQTICLAVKKVFESKEGGKEGGREGEDSKTSQTHEVHHFFFLSRNMNGINPINKLTISID